jgi:hypothetical protein
VKGAFTSDPIPSTSPFTTLGNSSKFPVTFPVASRSNATTDDDAQAYNSTPLFGKNTKLEPSPKVRVFVSADTIWVEWFMLHANWKRNSLSRFDVHVTVLFKLTLSVAGDVGLEVPICDSAEGVGTRAISRKTASYAKLYDAKEFALSSSAS